MIVINGSVEYTDECRCTSPGMSHRVVRRIVSDVLKDHSASVFRVKHTVCFVQLLFLHCLTLNYSLTDTVSHPRLHLQHHRVTMFCHVP